VEVIMASRVQSTYLIPLGHTYLACNCWASSWWYLKLKKKLNSMACSPQANYTDRAAAACQRS
jgi:hypothetical protein